MVEFAAEVSFTYVMGGLAREFPPDPKGVSARVRHWLDAEADSGMPVDARAWFGEPISSSFPASLAFCAAVAQAEDQGCAYLRRLREGLICFRRKLDDEDALAEEAAAAGLDAERFRHDFASEDVARAFDADLALASDIPPEAEEPTGRAARTWVSSACPSRPSASTGRTASAAG